MLLDVKRHYIRIELIKDDLGEVLKRRILPMQKH